MIHINSDVTNTHTYTYTQSHKLTRHIEARV